MNNKNIRFLSRGWDEKLKRMYYSNDDTIVFYNISPQGVSIRIKSESEFYNKEIQYNEGEPRCINKNYVKPLQCIGLVDKDGDIIYEGDVCEVEEYYSGDYKVKKHNVTIKWDRGFPCEIMDMDYANSPSREKIKVIGNIYENKELLTKTKE